MLRGFRSHVFNSLLKQEFLLVPRTWLAAPGLSTASGGCFPLLRPFCAVLSLDGFVGSSTIYPELSLLLRIPLGGVDREVVH